MMNDGKMSNDMTFKCFYYVFISYSSSFFFMLLLSTYNIQHQIQNHLYYDHTKMEYIYDEYMYVQKIKKKN